jgi:tripartite-type tricarboxylate transporter receptor subunit TctC
MLKKILALTLLVASSACLAKDTIKLIAPTPPGGWNDIVLRKMQKVINDDGKYIAVVINKPGGDGLVATNELLVEKDDTLMIGGLNLLIKSTSNEKTLATVKSLVPVIHIASFGTTFISNSPKIKTWKELIQESRTRVVNVGSTSLSQQMMLQELFGNNANINIIPFTGDTQGLQSLMSKDIEVLNVTNLTASIQLGNKSIVGLATTSGHLPSVPTLAELGQPLVLNSIFTGMIARPGTSPTKVAEYNAIISKVLEDPEIVDFFKKGMIIMPKDTTSSAYIRMFDNFYKQK